MFRSFDTLKDKRQMNVDNIRCYAWLFGMMATYVLRPQELWDWGRQSNGTRPGHASQALSPLDSR
jgi:hypothetical protein